MSTYDSEEDEFEGVTQWEADDWNGSESGTSQKSESEQEDSPQVSKAGPSTSRDDKVAKARAALAALKRKRTPSPDDSDSEAGASGKHAPAVMSSKRQVSRNRQVVTAPKRNQRDPRFSSASGHLDAHLHGKAYEFLPDLLKTELAQKKQDLSAAIKLEKSCPLRDKPLRTAERETIERQVGQLRTRMDKEKRLRREREVLSAAKREEREKRAQGKGEWHMKKGQKRDLLLRSRFDDLEASGGKNAVKKALDKKRKKVAGKEKKSRPDARRM